MKTEHPAIAVNEMMVAFGGQTVLESFSLALDCGQSVTLSGPSGCGKSTVLKCLLGLVCPATGTIAIQGQALSAHSVWELRQHMAYVPQEPDLGTGSVQEVLERPFAFRANTEQRSSLNNVADWLERVDLSPDLLTQAVTSLSGGERQRVALVGALLLERPILLLDEVTAALDGNRRTCVAALLRDLEATCLIVTHDRDLFDFADQHVALPGREGAFA